VEEARAELLGLPEPQSGPAGGGSPSGQVGSAHFFGASEHTLDKKGRLIIASRHRETLGPSVVIVRGFAHDPCLWIMPRSAWDRFCARYLDQIPDNDFDRAEAARDYRANAYEVEQDNQGRVLIPEALRKYADIQSEIMMVPNRDRLEVFDLDSWRQRTARKDHTWVLDQLRAPETPARGGAGEVEEP